MNDTYSRVPQLHEPVFCPSSGSVGPGISLKAARQEEKLHFHPGPEARILPAFWRVNPRKQVAWEQNPPALVSFCKFARIGVTDLLVSMCVQARKA